ncbi:MAG: gamma-glutamyl-gamma-aminobutyrate hydrolase family protein, partial [Alphaproteobacteria bacterium]|nr:gamma-glutamyl-gamma-aminobutyrate hydrolase family protein [Alphaproteobacteria bacterium]
MPASNQRPLIGIVGDMRQFNGIDVHGVSHRYVTAVIDGSDGIPVLLASIGTDETGGLYPTAALLDRLDGLLLTGGRSNVEPHHYDGPPFRDGTLRDPLRDATTLPLVRAALAAGVPLFGICRGIQEMNVALGGSLHPYLWEVEGVRDHRMRINAPLEDRVGPRHPMRCVPGGWFERWARDAGLDPQGFMVNSLHGQGLDRLAPGVILEAVADDGVVEGIRIGTARAFAVGVQWHAEHGARGHPFSEVLFARFGEACRARAIA